MTTNAEAAAVLYPTPQAPANSTAAQTLYPTATPSAAPDKPADGGGQPSTNAQAAATLYRTAPTFDPEQTPPKTEEPDIAADADTLYAEEPETIEHVRWDEPPAEAGELREVIEKALTGSDAFDPRADLPTLANAFSTVGVGQTFAREAMMHAVYAASDTYEPMEPAQVVGELRKSWGRNYDKNLTRIQAAVRAANDKDPRIMQFLNRTGLGNDLAFIKKVHASLRRRR